MPFWDSLNSINDLTNVFRWVLISCGVITAITSLFLLIYSNRKDVLTKQFESSKELKYDSTLTLQTETIASLKAENESLKSNQKIISEKVESVQTLTSPRILTEKQIQQIVSSLSNKTKETIFVYFFMGDEESFGYAKQILNTIVKAGFSADIPRPIMYSAPVTDIILRIKDLKFAKSGDNLINAFNEAGILIKKELNPNLDTNFELFVGQKPKQ